MIPDHSHQLDVPTFTFSCSEEHTMAESFCSTLTVTWLYKRVIQFGGNPI